LELNCPLFSIKKCWGKGFVLTNVVWANSFKLQNIKINNTLILILPKEYTCHIRGKLMNMI